MPIPELMAGWSRFRAGRYQQQRELFDRVAREGQKPNTAMVACCDSRVDPAILFDCDPGELFIVRNVANLVPPFEEVGAYHGTSAAIEFAVTMLAVEHIVVLGHSQCGGIRALLEGPPKISDPMPFLVAWMDLAKEARERTLAAAHAHPEAQEEYCEQLAIGLSLRNLLTFPAIRERVSARKLSLHGLHFDLHNGELSQLDAEQGRFLPVSVDEPSPG
jgi:carbonic anhydrase